MAVIPARYGSSRFPGKPLAEIAGKPMIQHVYERTARATTVDAVLVATDDERIAAAVQSFGGRAIMTPVEITSGSDRIAHVIRSLPDVDIVVNVQGDEPTVEPSMIDEAVQPLLGQSDLVAATLVRRIEKKEDLFNPDIPKTVLDDDGSCLYFSRSVIPYPRDVSQESWLDHHTFYKHIGLYVFRRDFLLTYARLPRGPLESIENLEQLRILEHGFRIRAVITEYDTCPVDTEADLGRVRLLLKARL